MESIFGAEEAGVAVKEICRKHNISDATFYTWRKKYRGMGTEDIRRLKQLEAENAKLKRLRARCCIQNLLLLKNYPLLVSGKSSGKLTEIESSGDDRRVCEFCVR